MRRAGTLPRPRADVAMLLAFVAVARLGTVGRAAEALGRTQPSISARLAGLEDLWSTRLFRREARGMRLTPEGRRLLPVAESALQALERIDLVAGLPVAAPLQVRVGAGDALGRELLPRTLRRLVREQGDVEVQLREGPGPHLLDSLRRGEIDLALVVRPEVGPGDRDLDLRLLTRSPVDLLMPSGHRLAHRRFVAAGALARERLVTLQADSAFRRHFEAQLARRGIHPRPAVEVGNLSLVRRFVSAGLGVAAVPAIAFRQSDPGPAVARARLRGVESVDYHSATRRGAPLPPPTRRLLELLTDPAG